MVYSGGGVGGHRGQALRQWAYRRCGACREGPFYYTGKEHQPGRQREEEDWWRQVVLGPLSSVVEGAFPVCSGSRKHLGRKHAPGASSAGRSSSVCQSHKAKKNEQEAQCKHIVTLILNHTELTVTLHTEDTQCSESSVEK